MIQRTTNKNPANYPRFGGSGVELDPRWRKFENFLADVGVKPSSKHSIGRIFDLPLYSKHLAVWQTKSGQSLHKLAHHFFEGKVAGWSSRKLNAVAKFITATIANAPDIEPDGANDLQILELLHQPPQAA
jgi:hypothetical protein